ncbi:MAG: YqfO family protein [Pseudomonadales bacterium]|nr:YqfO family protein [Pseudomonadales bacterium]
MYKLVFFVPADHKEAVKKAVFGAGAGKIGDYECCSWEVLGTGQFRPLSGANPYVGKQQQLEHVPEYRVEMVCADDLIQEVVVAMKRAHPYEEPAYDVWKLEVF